MKATATELNKHSGRYLTQSMREPVVIERSHHPVAVIISYECYMALEDAYWGELAMAAKKDGEFMSAEETMDFLRGDD